MPLQADSANIQGVVTCLQVQPNQACITDAMIVGGAGINGSKVQHELNTWYNLFPLATNLAALSYDFYCSWQAGTVLNFAAVITGTAGSGTTATVDLQTSLDTANSFASILTGSTPITLSTLAACKMSTQTIATPAYVQYTHFRFVVAASGGTVPKGLMVGVQLKESPS
jgi:hypothetical protein